MKQQNNLLLKRPIGRPHVTIAWDDAPRLIVHHNHWISKLCSRFFRTPVKTYFSLDSQGSFVWSHCNGQYTVGEIANLLHTEFGTEAEPVIERLILFLRILIGRKLIFLQD